VTAGIEQIPLGRIVCHVCHTFCEIISTK
jgi:hypothetical protein